MIGPPMVITDLLAGLGVGQQVVLALSVGFVVWYSYRAMGFSRVIGGLIGQTVRYAMAVASFVAIGIAFGWIRPFAMGEDLSAAARELSRLVGRYAVDVVRWAVDLLAGVLA